MTKLENGLFIFHRDFRIIDNVGLLEASKRVKKLYTCFIFTPEQVTGKNKYRSTNSIQFMIESLVELQKEIENNGGSLMIHYGDTTIITNKLIKQLDISGVYYNKDYSPYALKRDSEIEVLCEKHGIECMNYADYYLYEPGTVVVASSGEAYKKYTPFYREVLNRKVEKPDKKSIKNLSTSSAITDNTTLDIMFKKYAANNDKILVRGGRKNALKKLLEAGDKQKQYDEKRDYFKEKTTHLSAYIKFGCVSIREVYHLFRGKFGIHHGLIRELIWREFFAHVLYAYPSVVGKSYQPRYRNIKWRQSEVDLKRWQEGNTGFPMVDACMREMNTTGYMHNRGRMTVASFLIKTLLLDWRLGEQYFAQKLTDYDIASNNGNWQGISGTGVDMKPYFRDMNPWIQSKKFDNDATYIKKWVPELSIVDAKDIHKWNDTYKNYSSVNYPKPMVDYLERKTAMLDMYKNI